MMRVYFAACTGLLYSSLIRSKQTTTRNVDHSTVGGMSIFFYDDFFRHMDRAHLENQDLLYAPIYDLQLQVLGQHHDEKATADTDVGAGSLFFRSHALQRMDSISPPQDLRRTRILAHFIIIIEDLLRQPICIIHLHSTSFQRSPSRSGDTGSCEPRWRQ